MQGVAVGRFRIRPEPDKNLDRCERVANRLTGIVVARGATNRPLAMLVHDHLEPHNEKVAIVEMERAPKASLAIEQLVAVVAPFV